MRLPDLATWFAEVLAEDHGCRLDAQMNATRNPCPHCREKGDLLALAWSERFPWAERL